jgi:predicted Zn-dependent protease with MMP-like domain
MMTDDNLLRKWAEVEVEAVVRDLPAEVKAALESCVISFEMTPGADAWDDELDGDELGVFEGASLLEESSSADMPRIRLFLTNLWDWVEEDEQDFREEVTTTFLHELGHFLGWEEDDLTERGLD